MKRVLRTVGLFILMTAMVFTCFPVFTGYTVYADDSDFVIVDGVLTAYNGSDSDVVVPDGVTTIGDGTNVVFRGTFNSITLPEGTTSIDRRSFAADSISELYLPSTLATVRKEAFKGMPTGSISQVNYNGTNNMWLQVYVYYDEDDDVDENRALRNAAKNYLLERNPDDDLLTVNLISGSSERSFTVLRGYSLNEDPIGKAEYEAAVASITSNTLVGWYDRNNDVALDSDIYDHIFDCDSGIEYFYAQYNSWNNTVTFKNYNGYFNDDPSVTEISYEIPYNKTIKDVIGCAPYPNISNGAFDFWNGDGHEDYSIIGRGIINCYAYNNLEFRPSWKSGSGSDYIVIQYNPNGGIFSDTNNDVTHMDEFPSFNYYGTFNPPEVTREGYVLLGWALDPESTDPADLFDYQTNKFTTSFGSRHINHVYAIWKRAYTVTWENWDETVLETDELVKEGDMPEYNGETPTRPDDDYTYTFTGWAPTVSEVTGDITYTAQYDSRYLLHTVTWKNWDGSVLETDELVREGTMPEYNGETPTKPEDDDYVYSFTGWSPKVSEVTGDAVYTADFYKAAKRATIIDWNDGDEIGETELTGGTEEEPFIVKVHGTVTLTGSVTVSSGYVEFVKAEDTDSAILKNGLDASNSYMIQAANYNTKVSIFGIKIDGNNVQGNGINAQEGTTVDLNNCAIYNIIGYDTLRVNGDVNINNTVIFDNRRGIYCANINHRLTVKNSEIKNNTEYGLTLSEGVLYLENTSITGNNVGLIASGSNWRNLYLGGNIEIKDNTEKDLDMGGSGTTSVFLNDAVTGEVNMTNKALSVGETILVKKNAGSAVAYTPTEEDAAVFHYVPTEEQSTGMIIGTPHVNADGNIVVDCTVNREINWYDGDEIGETNLSGGTEEEPVIVNVHGTVTLTGPVTVSSGYVEFVKAEDTESAILKNGLNSSNSYMIQAANYNTKVLLSGIDIDGNEVQGNGIYAQNGTTVNLNNCTVYNIIGYDTLRVYGNVNINNTVIHDNRGGIYCYNVNHSLNIENSEIKDNAEYGINLSGGTVRCKNTSITGNNVGLYTSGSNWKNLYLSGNIEIKDNIQKDFDMGGSVFNVYLSDAVTGEVNMTNKALSIGETVLVSKMSNVGSTVAYTPTEEDAAVFHYIPTEEQSTGMIISTPHVNSDGNIVVDCTVNREINWYDGDEIGVTELTGGTEEEPVIVKVHGTVTLTGSVTVSSGYVEFVKAEDTEVATLKNSLNTNNSYMIQVSNYSTKVSINGIEIDGNNVQGNGINAQEGTTVDLNNCAIYNIIGYDTLRVNGDMNINDTVIRDNETGIYCANINYRLTVKNSEIKNNTECGITLSEGVLYLENTSITGNNVGLIASGSNWRNLYLGGNIEIKDNTEKDLDMGGSSTTSVFLNDAVTGEVNMTNKALSVGETILVKKNAGSAVAYTPTEEDAAVFHYVMTDAQTAGNAILGETRINDDGNIVINTYFKTYLIGNTEGFELIPVNDDNELPIIEDTDENGKYYLAQEGSEVHYKLAVKEKYKIGSEFKIWVNHVEVPTNKEGEYIHFEYVVVGESTIEVTGIEEEPYEAVHLAGNSLTLDGDIGVNFYLNIPEETAAVANVKLTFHDVTDEYDVSKMEATDNGYKFTVRTAAKEMRDPIQLVIEDKNGDRIQLLSESGNTDYTQTGYTYTVTKYLKLAKEKYSTEKPKLASLAENMEIYGVYAQKYFNYNASELEDIDLSDVTLENVEQYKSIKSANYTLPEGLTYIGSTLTLETITTFSHYFTVAEGHDINEYTFTVSGRQVEVKEGEGNNQGKYKVEFKDIAAKNLDKFQTLTVSGGGKEFTIDYCALSYARTAIKNNLKEADLSRALYKYFKAAESYFA